MAFFLFILIVAAIGGLIFLGLQLLTFKKENEQLGSELSNQQQEQAAKVGKYEAHIKKLTDYANGLKDKVQRLAKWQKMADAEIQAEALLVSARDELAKAESEARRLTENAEQQAKALVADADATLAKAKTEADHLDASAQQQAAALLLSAQNEAREIPEDARRQAAAYEQTARAMKNLIEGYGNQYLIPTRSLLDELAEDFGHKEAGQELKRARENSLLMIRNGTAGRCNYVEANRRETAVNFVVDAFNGKVDSILSRVKNDNVGTLQQAIHDAFAVVSLNGKAFRDATITEEYLAARLDELKWAAVTQQLKLDEREEQKRIKDQIREEEKARREYERAIREAAKEEELIRKAIEKAQEQMGHATAQQRADYERQLEELTQRLTDAESRNQRALSMAQQTKRGHVYVISNVGSFGENVYKIGLTRRLEPLDRIRELGDSSVPFEFDVHALLFSDDAPALENQLHKHFVMMQMNKVNYRKEFFKVDLSHIRGEIETLGLSAKWTMISEAKEYRETLAIEKAIRDNPVQREAWTKRQLSLEVVDNEFIEPAEVEAE